MLKIDVIHGSCDARAAGVSLGWKGETNCISNCSNVLRVRGPRGLLCPRLVTPVTPSQHPFSLLMPIAALAVDQSEIWGFSTHGGTGLQVFKGLEGVLGFAFLP